MFFCSFVRRAVVARVLCSFLEQHGLHLMDDHFLLLHDFRQPFGLIGSVGSERTSFREVASSGGRGAVHLERGRLRFHDAEVCRFQLERGDLDLRVRREVGHSGRPGLEEVQF